MTFAFDLISDLHVETWDPLDWDYRATAPYCVIAGDIGRDRDQVVKTLTHLNDHYAGIFYIDGNEEHRYYLENLEDSYRDLDESIRHLDKVVFMQDNVVIINGVAILATNGWWSYDFDPEIDPEQTLDWYKEYIDVSTSAAEAVTGVAYRDASYFVNSVHKLQTHKEVNSIVLVNHTLPAPWLASHDLDLAGQYRFNCLGNQHLQLALEQDTEEKVKVWCFGHYHRPIDQTHMGIRYVSNPRGRGDTPWSQPAYNAVRIEVPI